MHFPGLSASEKHKAEIQTSKCNDIIKSVSERKFNAEKENENNKKNANVS